MRLEAPLSDTNGVATKKRANKWGVLAKEWLAGNETNPVKRYSNAASRAGPQMYTEGIDAASIRSAVEGKTFENKPYAPKARARLQEIEKQVIEHDEITTEQILDYRD